MSHPVTKEEIVQELDRIPDEKLEELFQVVQSFGVEPTAKETPELEAFAGSWKDWSEPNGADLSTSFVKFKSMKSA